MRAKSLTGPVLGLYAIKTLLVATVFVVLLLSLLALERDTAASRRTANFLTGSLDAERSVLELQNGVRGYLLTRTPSSLRPVQMARADLPMQLRALTAQSRSAVERSALTMIRAGVAGYLSTVVEPTVSRHGHVSPPELRAVIGRGDGLIDTIRDRFARLESSALALRARRRSAVSRLVTLSIVIAAIGLALLIAVELGFVGFLVRGVLRPVRRVARAAGDLARGNLSVRVAAAGFGEPAQLAESFNEMAESTKQRTAELARARERLAQAVDTAEQASDMKSNFVANMSHEIRTPLNGLVGMLTLLSETPLEAEQREFVDMARSSSEALMRVLGDVLDIAKIEAGRLEFELLDFDVHDAVESVCDVMAAAAGIKSLELQAFVHENVPRAVRGDRVRVCQILNNLVSNAIKFTSEGEVGVEVSCADHGLVRFAVRDSGIGIEPDRIQDLFERFVQADEGTTRRFGGTGLGLAISRELAELMGGTLEAVSAPGRGSVFTLELPFEPAEAPAVPLAGETALAGVRVLVVDDGATNRRVFQSYLTAFGARAQVTSGVGEAIAALRAAAAAGDPFRVALVDMNLEEGETGLDVARAVGDDPALGDARVILVTSSGFGRAGDALEGIQRRLIKPVRRARLLEAIVGVLRESAARAGEVAAATGARGMLGGGTGEPTAPAVGGRVLVAEDHEVNWMLIERMLRLRGCEVERACDGDDVLARLAAGAAPYDLILMDCQMPGRDGFDTTRELRRREREADEDLHVPIVAMTANAMLGVRERCLDAGMDDYLPKPIGTEQLDTILARWIPAGRLDAERIDELRRLFPGDQLKGVIDELTAEVGRDLSELSQAVAERDLARTAALAHRIRNTGRLIGARTLIDGAARLDRPPRPGEPAPEIAWPEAGETVRRLEAAWTNAQAALSELIGNIR